MSNAEISIKVIHSSVGGINESDVLLAAASNAVIIGFNVRPEIKAEELARREEVEIKTYRVIYDVVSDVKKAMEGLLEPEEKEASMGWLEVKEVFKVPKVGNIAGCYVKEGKILSKRRKSSQLRSTIIKTFL